MGGNVTLALKKG